MIQGPSASKPAPPSALKDVRSCSDDQCCRELLSAAAEGAFPEDQSLERTLDHLERNT